MMEDTIVLAETLRQEWKDLGADVQKQKKIKLDRFESVFSQTYTLLSKHLEQTSLDRRMVELIAEAYLFANTKDDALDYTCLAAFVLTERMLACCAFGKAATVSAPSAIYIAEARRDILLDFNDVTESIDSLTKVFEDMYWKKIKA